MSLPTSLPEYFEYTFGVKLTTPLESMGRYRNSNESQLFEHLTRAVLADDISDIRAITLALHRWLNVSESTIIESIEHTLTHGNGAGPQKR